MTIMICTEEQYLSLHDAGLDRLGDAGLHKANSRISRKQWDRKVDNQRVKDLELVNLRERLRDEYRQKVEAGEIRPPTRIEKLRRTAAGNPDNESVRAARRILASMNANEE